ncbi:MAG: hypothetical protein MJZ65_06575, partial [Paludibacteraceae bacterium]|nr:hypothetical protein [Paludibacteraceae bacterium]
MKHFQNIVLPLVLAIITCPVWAQGIEPELPPEIEPEPLPVKEYVTLDTTEVEIFYSQLPYLWRELSITAEGVYSDTVKVEDIATEDTIYSVRLVYKKEYINQPLETVGKYPNELPFLWHGQTLNATGTYLDTI